MEKIKVLITDDQTELAEELKSVLQTDENLQVIGIAKDGFDALERMSETVPDVVLMDIRMPNMNGVVATQRIKATYPNVKVVILTTFDDSDYILSAINNGASGYLLKDIGGAALIDAVKNAHAGDTILPSKIARRITDAAKHVAADREIKLTRAFALSDREVEIALMMYEGFTNRQISTALKLSEGTTRNYVSSIYEKTHSENRAEAVQAIKKVL
ncbi:MAG: response regulator transcription factor [Clostridia bacterium]|nr:response regulator transcription factor [Clostridiales bacterium]MBQ3506279.1 response regulator transcription factor [Clostridia bacterium]